MRNQRTLKRRGAIVPLTALCLVAMLAFVALALDIGLLMISRNQAQNAADSAAMAGARTLTGNAANNNNYSQVLPNAQAVVAANNILGSQITTSQLTLTIGDYYYNSSTGSFAINANGRQTGDNWTLVQATVTGSQPSFFAGAFGFNTLNTSAIATAIHRPRDTVVVVDFSGSMRFESLLAFPPTSNPRTTSMNPDPNYPTFGHYAGNSSQLIYSTDQQVASGEICGPSNITSITTLSDRSAVSCFYADTTPFGNTTQAFTAAPSSYGTTPGGDAPQLTSKGSGTTYASSVSQYLAGNNTTTARDPLFELDGYSAYSNGAQNTTTAAATSYSAVPFAGYTQGPGYYGKTFFLWPPDPRCPVTTAAPVGASSGVFTGGSTGTLTTLVNKFLCDFWGVSSASSLPANVQAIATNWTTYTASSLQTYLTGTVGLATTDSKYLRTMRLFNRGGGAAAGMPTDGVPNPVPCDWRARFFLTPAGAPVTDNSLLFNSSGTWNTPSSTTYLINYAAILDWIQFSGPNPFPNQLRAGGVVYYTSIPTSINTATFPPPDPNQRIWKEYIDGVLGWQQTGGSGTNPTYQDVSGNCGYGGDITWGTTGTSGKPSSWPAQYMSYTDNPDRPLLRFWFGPMSFLDHIGNYNVYEPYNSGHPRLWWPGTCAEAPTYQTKLGIQAALNDTVQNHPNDNVAVVFFSAPINSSTGGYGFYNMAAQPLGRNQRAMINSLWFSPKVNSTNAEISLYDASGNQTNDIYAVPRANGGTCYAMGLMNAYNQFSSNSALVNFTANAAPGTAGGLGRNGSQRLVVFESDGMVNTGATASLTGSTNGTGYYKIRVADANNPSGSGTELPSSSTENISNTAPSQGIVSQICAPLGSGGYGTTRKPVYVNCIAFGSLFDPTNNSTYKTAALQNLATFEVIGNVQKSGATTLAANKIITGPFQTRIQNMQAAFQGIMQDGIQVTLISTQPGVLP
jgi:Flp pilus assembly protein TadG